MPGLIDNPGFQPLALAEFRTRLWHDAAGQSVFQRMLARLARLGPVAQEASVTAVLSTVDTVTRMDELNEAMHRALEALAGSDPDRLRKITQPYWYRRYRSATPCLCVPHTQAEQHALLEALEADISSLLAAIAEDEPTLLQWPEVQVLDRLWQQSFGWANASRHKGLLGRACSARPAKSPTGFLEIERSHENEASYC